MEDVQGGAAALRDAAAVRDAADESSLTVQVLLATYNGARFVAEQMESLLAQDYPRMEILVRDDGSADGTLAILEQYARREPERVRLLCDGVSSGSAKGNFVRLLEASTAAYVCLCDQDDVWIRDKVSVSMAAMQSLEARHGSDAPLLVFTDLTVVDEALHLVHPSFWRQAILNPQDIHRLRTMLGQNVVTGCTALMNRALVELALPMPAEVPMHDRWIALLATAFGHAAVLRRPTVLYRQHGGNVIGARLEQDTVAAMVQRTRDAAKRLEQWRINQEVAAALLRTHGGRLRPEQTRLLLAYLRCGSSPHRLVRVLTLLRHRFFRKGVLRNLATLWTVWTLQPERGDEG